MYIYILLIASMAVSASSRALHKEMSSPSERAMVFGESEKVPDYEIVPIYMQNALKDSVNERLYLRLNTFGKNIKFWLQSSNQVLYGDKMPIYFVRNSNEKKLQFRSADIMKELLPFLYQNFEYATTIAVIAGQNGTKRMSGVIQSESLVIRPLPERFVESKSRTKRTFGNTTKLSNEDEYHYHIVYKTKFATKDNDLMEQSSQALKNSLKIIKRSIPNVVYPEILIIVDHSLYKVLNDNVADVVLYLLAFWNSVDMLYRSLENPRFRLNIAAIILAEDDDALEYVSSSKIFDIIEYSTVLNNSRYWLYEHRSAIDINSYDVAVTMTSTVLCDVSLIARIYDMSKCWDPTLGAAYVLGACQSDENSVNKTLIIHDVGGFGGIHTAAHELAHSFGVQHDSFNNSKCIDNDGYIMSSNTLFNTVHRSDWSLCSLADFQKYLNSNQTCLYNKPEPGMNYGEFLPGKLMNVNAQCRKLEKTRAAKNDESICVELKCLKYNRLSKVIGKPGAADGTRCGDGKMCLHSQCISENEL